MAFQSKKARAAEQRSVERREREAFAPRLITSVPGLLALSIHIEDRDALAVLKHVRHVIVSRAPALFVVACGNETCDSKGHDITSEVMYGLRTRAKSFGGERQCDGSVGSAGCTRVLHFKATADYAGT